MRDSIGGVVNVFTIAVFLLLVSGYLAFSVSYNKAFRVKNKIITILERKGRYSEDAINEIDAFLKEIGYNATPAGDICKAYKESDSPAAFTCRPGYCVTWVKTSDNNNDNGPKGIESGYFRVTTSVHVDVPVINKLMPYLEFLYVSGDSISIEGEDAAENNTNTVFKTCG